jgi:hypothetical protein
MLMREAAMRMGFALSTADFEIQKREAICHRDNKFCEHNT